MTTTTATRTTRLVADLRADAPARTKRKPKPMRTVIRIPDGFDGQGHAMWLTDTAVVLVDLDVMPRLHQLAAASLMRLPRGVQVLPYAKHLAPTVQGISGSNVASLALWRHARQTLFVRG